MPQLTLEILKSSLQQATTWKYFFFVCLATASFSMAQPIVPVETVVRHAAPVATVRDFQSLNDSLIRRHNEVVPF